jgi:hypothetical protein
MVNLSLFEKDTTTLQILANAIEGNNDINLEHLNNFPSWLVILIQKRYKEEVNNWIEYLFDNIDDFCKENSESLINSGILDKGGISLIFNNKLTFEQKLWVSVQSKLSKNEITRFVTEIRDSLLPWLNINLYNKVQDKEKNTRTNTAYEEQRRKLLEGNLEELDVIK